MAAPIYWLASYPRAGNTWLRVLLANVLYGKMTSSAEIADQVPNIHRSIKGAHLLGKKARIIKTHWPYFPTLPLGNQTAGTIYIIRNPVDVLKSTIRYRFMTESADDRSLADEDIKRIVRDRVAEFIEARGDPGWSKDGFGTWVSNVRQWCNRNVPFPVFLVRYDDLQAHPAERLHAICKFIGEERSVKRIRNAVKNASIARMQELEQSEIESGERYLFHGSGTTDALLPDLPFVGSGATPEADLLALTPEEEVAARAAFAPQMKRFGFA